MEFERVEDHVLLITHRAVARVLLAYFQELNWEAITEVEVPPGRVFCVEPVSIRCKAHLGLTVEKVFRLTPFRRAETLWSDCCNILL
jgi:broad specificity phosphatase PhoE